MTSLVNQPTGTGTLRKVQASSNVTMLSVPLSFIIVNWLNVAPDMVTHYQVVVDLMLVTGLTWGSSRLAGYWTKERDNG